MNLLVINCILFHVLNAEARHDADDINMYMFFSEIKRWVWWLPPLAALLKDIFLTIRDAL